jgi:hypothetical protein
MWLLYCVAASAHNFAIVIAEELCVDAFVFACEGRNIHHLDFSFKVESGVYMAVFGDEF